MNSSTLAQPTPFSAAPLPHAFYNRPTATVAQDLLGRLLVCRDGDALRCGRIVETEAYVGPEDQASHASRGRTARTDVMFGPPGSAYVYLIYGMYHCLNAVTEPEGYPAAVLLRAVEPLLGIEGRTDGPGKLCRAMGIDRSLNRADLAGDRLSILPGDRPTDTPPPMEAIASGSRIGVGYAGSWADAPLRFWLKDNRWVSRPPAAPRAAPHGRGQAPALRRRGRAG